MIQKLIDEHDGKYRTHQSDQRDTKPQSKTQNVTQQIQQCLFPGVHIHISIHGWFVLR